MIDNQTIELLRKLLVEHGVEYEESQDRFCTKFRFNYCEACGDYLNSIELMGACITASKSYLTPEQAIAVTLESEREKALEELVRDMGFWGYEGHMDSKSQDWQMKHIDGVLDCMKELGVEVIDEGTIKQSC